mmetsp:Transcript_49087/g.36145  ORF Transcript_49087/g.36145 Transcript_49087/m.36145 type:complete len:122 (-) Transcript_49087:331-696(-)|eukprot:CAMPEP_0202979316 /NCGR_PEP_ID=MMETSP1396-20130829/85504_1 /ASSEMBLY_ACC=CAM_ASM_000872 /TAXON_ID= /ORGANISM="Pseudokeronopsis sp., Strain Brazil" /LENGTH=121 /DNA_ID=CAMNT_0049718695 /DNA_START=743 /DNA_END=1108 /DNA_ORIENTATION=+
MEYYYYDGAINWYTTDLSSVVNGFGILFYCFSNFPELFPLYTELYNPTHRRVTKWLHDSGLIFFKLCLIFTFLGYFSTYSFTPKYVLLRDNPPGLGNNLLLDIGSAFLLINMTISMALSIL